MPTGDFFDELVSFMKRESERTNTTWVAPNVIEEFYADIACQGAENTALKSENRVKNTSATLQQNPSTPAKDGATKTVSKSWKDLQDSVTECTKCSLAKGRNNTVFGEGNPNADLMFIGEGPGRDEDMQGRPFVGKAGMLLTKMVEAMGLNRDSVYIANIVKCRPPNNRNPEPDEAATCMPYLENQINLLKPKIIILLGAVPLQYILNKRGIMRLRGQWHDYMGIKVMPTLHPAYLLRYPDAKRDAWSDLKKVMSELGIALKQ